MKKTIALLMAFVMLLSLCACGGGSDAEEESTVPKATITKADGTTEVLTQEELKEIFKSNEINYNNNYRGCEITLEGSVKSVKQETKKIFDGVNAECVVFEVAEEGQVAVWEFFFTVAGLEKDGIDIATITPGTVIKVSGTLGETFIDTKIEEAHDLEIITAE